MSLRWIQGGFNAFLPATVLSDTEAKAAPVAGQAYYITDITLFGGATAGSWVIKSGTTTLLTVYTAINGFVNIHFRVPVKCVKSANINVTHPASVGSNGVISGFADRG